MQIYWGERERGVVVKSGVKICGSNVKIPLVLAALRTVEVGGIRCVAVKSLDITKNSECEGSLLNCH